MTTSDNNGRAPGNIRSFIALLIATIALGVFFNELLQRDSRRWSPVMIGAMLAAIAAAVISALVRRRRSRLPNEEL
jgi:uncharacterized BrkB/YihY/UPF0761 family membrane protein